MIGAHPAVAALVASGLRSDRFQVVEVTEAATPTEIRTSTTTVMWGATATMRANAQRLVSLLATCPPGSRAAFVALVWPHPPSASTAVRLLDRFDVVTAGTDSGHAHRLVLASAGLNADILAIVVESTAEVFEADEGRLDRLAAEADYLAMRPGDAAKTLAKLVGVPRARAYEAVTRARDNTEG